MRPGHAHRRHGTPRPAGQAAPIGPQARRHTSARRRTNLELHMKRRQPVEAITSTPTLTHTHTHTHPHPVTRSCRPRYSVEDIDCKLNTPPPLPPQMEPCHPYLAADPLRRALARHPPLPTSPHPNHALSRFPRDFPSRCPSCYPSLALSALLRGRRPRRLSESLPHGCPSRCFGTASPSEAGRRAPPQPRVFGGFCSIQETIQTINDLTII